MPSANCPPLQLAIYLLDFTLPQVAKLSEALQTEQLDLSLISSLVDATVQSLDDAVLPGANWVLELLDNIDDLKTATKMLIKCFHSRIPLLSLLLPI